MYKVVLKKENGNQNFRIMQVLCVPWKLPNQHVFHQKENVIFHVMVITSCESKIFNFYPVFIISTTKVSPENKYLKIVSGNSLISLLKLLWLVLPHLL